MIVGISGLIGSGKDTVADYLVNRWGYRRESWAGALKDAVSTVFGWDRTLLEGKTRASREWREQPDQWWSNRLRRTVTPRAVLQQWGTDVCRNGYHDEIWVAALENKLRNSADDIVISDCRFSNELDTVRRLGGITLRIVRGPNPPWVDLYQQDRHRFYREYPHIHSSEYSSVDLDYDYIVDNNGTIEELHQKISDLVQSRRSAIKCDAS